MAAPAYFVTDLGTLPGGTTSGARDINDALEVVGWSDIGGGVTHAFLYSNGARIDLTPLDVGKNSFASAVNSQGQACGIWIAPAGNVETGFLWTPSMPNGLTGKVDNIPPAGGGTSSAASDVNDGGIVIGSSFGQGGGRVLAYAGGKSIDLGNFTKSASSTGAAINNAGQILGGGARIVDGFPRYAYVCDYDAENASMTSQTELNFSGNDTYNDALALNDASPLGVVMHVVFSKADADFEIMQCGNAPLNGHFPVTGSAQIHANLGGDYDAEDNNDQGQVVGSILLPGLVTHAYLWSPDQPNALTGSLVDLNTLIAPNSGWELTTATAINNRGYIVGDGFHNGQRRAFLLTPSWQAHVGIQGAAAVLQILVGIVAGSGGWVWPFGGGPHPEPPPLPFFANFSPAQQDTLISLVLSELAKFSGSETGRRELEKAASNLTALSLRELLNTLDKRG